MLAAEQQTQHYKGPFRASKHVLHEIDRVVQVTLPGGQKTSIDEAMQGSIAYGLADLEKAGTDIMNAIWENPIARDVIGYWFIENWAAEHQSLPIVKLAFLLVAHAAKHRRVPVIVIIEELRKAQDELSVKYALHI